MTKSKAAMVLFCQESKQVFDSFMSGFGFSFLSGKTEEYSSETTYRKGDLYLQVSANIHPRDYPASFNIILGEGSIEWPESDWNSIALWRIKQSNNSRIKSGEYVLKDFNSFLKPLTASRKDVEIYASKFLTGDLSVFKETRSIQNRSREPYKIYTPNPDGGYSESIDKASQKLKEKFS